MSDLTLNARIKPLDGLRTFAAFGVVWIHSWAFYGNPSLNILGFDLYRLMAIAGNGVDFFFVISGFCMYLMTSDRKFSTGNYLYFIYRRFQRIAPAFYVSVLVYAILIKMNDPAFLFSYNVIFHFLFLNNVVTGNTISGPFWSIGTEWHFYIFLPFIIIISRKLSLPKTLLIFSLISITLFCYVNAGYLSYDWWESQILIRFPEFAIGIYAAWLFKKGRKLPGIFLGVKGIIITLIIMYAGRIMKFTPFLEAMGDAGFLFKSIADVIMVSGFGLLLLHVISQVSFVSDFLSGKVITYLGRISYSVYLWHSLSIILLAPLLKRIPFGSLNVFAGFLLISICTVIISHFSYKYLEAFYFSRNRENKITHNLAGTSVKTV